MTGPDALRRSPNGVNSSKPIAIRLLPSEIASIKAVALRERRSVASVARLACLRGLAEYQLDKTALIA